MSGQLTNVVLAHDDLYYPLYKSTAERAWMAKVISIGQREWADILYDEILPCALRQLTVYTDTMNLLEGLHDWRKKKCSFTQGLNASAHPTKSSGHFLLLNIFFNSLLLFSRCRCCCCFTVCHNKRYAARHQSLQMEIY